MLDQKSGRLVQRSILMFGEGQLDLGELAVGGLRRLVHAGRHQGVLILLAGHLIDGEMNDLSSLSSVCSIRNRVHPKMLFCHLLFLVSFQTFPLATTLPYSLNK